MTTPDNPTTDEAAIAARDKPHQKGTTMSNDSETAGLDFLDFLFTIAMSIGLTPELLQVSFVTGLLSEEWQKTGRWPAGDEVFHIGVFILGFLNITLSWFGYHASIRSRPLNYHSGYGMIRFMFDVVLVIAYGIILIKYKNFDIALTLLVIIYIVFVIWDILKINEYWENADPGKAFKNRYDSNKNSLKGIITAFRREFVSLFWCLLFIGLGIAYFCWHLNKWVALVSAIFITVLYRFNKNHPTWERLFGVTNA